MKAKDLKLTEIYHVDCEFEGKRLVDDVTVLVLPENNRKKLVFCYCKKLRANIFLPIRELKTV